MDLSFIGESKIDPKEVLLSLRLDLEVGDSASSHGMSAHRATVNVISHASQLALFYVGAKKRLCAGANND